MVFRLWFLPTLYKDYYDRGGTTTHNTRGRYLWCIPWDSLTSGGLCYGGCDVWTLLYGVAFIFSVVDWWGANATWTMPRFIASDIWLIFAYIRTFTTMGQAVTKFRQCRNLFATFDTGYKRRFTLQAVILCTRTLFTYLATDQTTTQFIDRTFFFMRLLLKDNRCRFITTLTTNWDLIFFRYLVAPGRE